MHHRVKTFHLGRRGDRLLEKLTVSQCHFCVPPRDPNPKVERLYDTERDDHMLRVQNFSILNRHLRAFYQVGRGMQGREG